MSLREQILKANDFKLARVETPEWPCGFVYVRTLTPRERMERERVSDDGKNVQRLIAATVATVTCDEQGKRVFEDGDVEALMDRNGAVIDRIFNAAYLLAADGKLEDAKKNSSEVPNDN